jgi:hypothetical protein
MLIISPAAVGYADGENLTIISLPINLGLRIHL